MNSPSGNTAPERTSAHGPQLAGSVLPPMSKAVSRQAGTLLEAQEAQQWAPVQDLHLHRWGQTRSARWYVGIYPRNSRLLTLVL